MHFLTKSVQDQGPRDYQEDRRYESEKLIAVIDGMGGHRDGAAAADAALHVLQGRECASVDEVRELIRECHEAVCELAYPGEFRMPGAVIALAAIADDELIVGWCGDSRAVFNGVQVTKPHGGSYGLESFLGYSRGFMAETWFTKLEEGDSVVVASDGFDMLDPLELTFDADLQGLVKVESLFDNTTAVQAKVVLS